MLKNKYIKGINSSVLYKTNNTDYIINKKNNVKIVWTIKAKKMAS